MREREREYKKIRVLSPIKLYMLLDILEMIHQLKEET